MNLIFQVIRYHVLNRINILGYNYHKIQLQFSISVIAKMLFFAGFAVGTFGAGLISDRYGRKSAIVLMAQLLFGCGILTATMSNMVGFAIMWFLTGM